MSDKHKGRQVPVNLWGLGFEKRMLFNRFSIEEDGSYRILRFGYISKGHLLDHFAAACNKFVIDSQREENLKYLGEIGDIPLEEPEPWTLPTTDYKIQLFSLIGLTRRDSEAEITLHNYSSKQLVEVQRSSKKAEQLVAEPIALLRSEINIHKHFLRALHPLK